MALPGSLTTVNRISKIVALILFILLPFGTFFLGRITVPKFIPSPSVVKQQQSQQKSITQPLENTYTFADGYGWQKYKDDAYGFSFMYPALETVNGDHWSTPSAAVDQKSTVYLPDYRLTIEVRNPKEDRAGYVPISISVWSNTKNLDAYHWLLDKGIISSDGTNRFWGIPVQHSYVIDHTLAMRVELANYTAYYVPYAHDNNHFMYEITWGDTGGEATPVLFNTTSLLPVTSHQDFNSMLGSFTFQGTP
jgi:hypothetical protein